MAETLSVRLTKQDLDGLAVVSREWKTDKSEVVRRLLAKALQEWKVEKALKDLQMHKISVGLAAKQAGLNLWEILDLIKERNIDWTGYSKEDLAKDLMALEGK